MSGFTPKLEDISFREHGPKTESHSGIQYFWDHQYINPLAMVAVLPTREWPRMHWGLKVAERLLHALANSVAVDASSTELAQFEARLQSLKRDVASGQLRLETLMQVVSDVVQHGRLTGSATRGADHDDRPRSIDDYAALFKIIGLPAVARHHNTDANFAAMRTAGPNPLVIERLTEPMAHFPVTEQHYQFVLPGDSLAAAMAEGRLYICDYHKLETLEVDVSQEPAKYPYSPIALFTAHPQTGALLPVAIQPQQRPGPESPIYIADGSYDWLMAKTIVEMADGNLHEAVSHLGRTHLFMEPFAVASARSLPPANPLGRLLRPHFEGTLFINFAAVRTLVAPGGDVEGLLNGSLKSALEMTVNGLYDYPFNQQFLPASFATRGVEDLREYPYRDDALLYWKTISRWVRAYLEHYYGGRDLSKDRILQAWYRDLVDPNGGRVVNFGEVGGIYKLDYLVDAVTLILFTASVQHAAVNFPQLDLMSYCPNMPLATYDRFPRGDHPARAQDYLNLLPPMAKARRQQLVMHLLGSVHYTELGQYKPTAFDPKITQGPLADFQADLATAGRTIQTRNINRRPYNTLNPEGIPQSINV